MPSEFLPVIEAAQPEDEVTDTPGFEAFYRSHFTGVVALVYGLSGSRSAGEEIAQEAFFAAARRWDELSAYDDPGAWVRRVAMNKAVSAVRRRGAEARAMARLAARRPRPDPLPEEDEAFWAAVRSLPGHQAQAVALFYLEDRPVVEIAAVIGCAEATVRVHLHRGRRSLARRLDCSLEEE